MFYDFTSFAFAIWQEWKLFLTGGSVIAVTSLVSLILQRPVPRAVNWLVLGLTFILAAFAAWRKEWVANGRGSVEVDPRTMVSLVAGVTDIHAKSRTKRFINKRITVKGTLLNVETNDVHLINRVRLFMQTDDGTYVHVAMPMHKGRDLFPVPVGTILRVVGRITSIASHGISLGSADVIQIEAPESPTRDQSSPPPSKD